MEALKMIQQSKIISQRKKPPLTKEEEFCRYLCSELKRIKSEKSFQEVKSKILELVTSKILEEDTIFQPPISPGFALEGAHKYRSRYSSTESSLKSPLSHIQHSTPEDFYDNSHTSASIPSYFEQTLSKEPHHKPLLSPPIQEFQQNPQTTIYENYETFEKSSIPSSDRYFRIIPTLSSSTSIPSHLPKSTVPKKLTQTSFLSPIISPPVPEICTNQQSTIYKQWPSTSTFIPSSDSYLPIIPTYNTKKQNAIKILENRIIKKADHLKINTTKDVLEMAVEDTFGDRYLDGDYVEYQFDE